MDMESLVSGRMGSLFWKRNFGRTNCEPLEPILDPPGGRDRQWRHCGRPSVRTLGNTDWSVFRNDSEDLYLLSVPSANSERHQTSSVSSDSGSNSRRKKHRLTKSLSTYLKLLVCYLLFILVAIPIWQEVAGCFSDGRHLRPSGQRTGVTQRRETERKKKKELVFNSLHAALIRCGGREKFSPGWALNALRMERPQRGSQHRTNCKASHANISATTEDMPQEFQGTNTW